MRNQEEEEEATDQDGATVVLKKRVKAYLKGEI